METTAVIVVLVALGFGYTNGFHDAANAIAISISTRGSSPITITCSGATPSCPATKRRAACEGLPVSSGSTPVTRTIAPAMAQL